MNRKLISLICILTLCFCLGACGSENQIAKTSENTETEQEVKSVQEKPSSNSEITNDKQEQDRIYEANVSSVINLSINPEIEFEVDDSGKISKVIYCNDDAKLAYEELVLEGMTPAEALALAIKTADEKGYLKEGNDITLSYGATGNIDSATSREVIEEARQAVCDSLNESGKNSALVLNVNNYCDNAENICDLCYGVGMIICENCGGKSYGNGMVLCDLCNGSGIGEDDSTASDLPEGACPGCGGSGIVSIQAQTCYICNGTGLCINCGGSGQELCDDGSIGSCHACGGSGDCLQEVCEGGIMVARQGTCGDCDGTGKDLGRGNHHDDTHHGCNRCDGIGYMTCNGCNGNLMSTCYRCDGTGVPVPHED